MNRVNIQELRILLKDLHFVETEPRKFYCGARKMTVLVNPEATVPGAYIELVLRASEVTKALTRAGKANASMVSFVCSQESKLQLVS